MQCAITLEENFPQLTTVLQCPIIEIDPENLSKSFFVTEQLLRNSNNCCIVIATSTNSDKLQNLKMLYRGLATLKRLQMRLSKDYGILDSSIVGIYPSLEYPATVYELNTPADRYVSTNVLPITSSALMGVTKKLISRFIGINPAVGGVGLILYEE